MTSGLLITAALMGAVGVPHCLVMCGVPCFAAARACGTPGRADEGGLAAALQLGRLLGYAALGALAASLVSFAHLVAGNVTALRPLWVMAQAAILVLGLVLLATGCMPQWLQTAHLPLHKLSDWLSGGMLGKLPRTARAIVVGACWAVLPCAQLYAAVVLASMANGPWSGAAVMAAYALPGGLFLWLGGQWLVRLIGLKPASQSSPATIQVVRDASGIRRWDRLIDATWAVRATGAVLAASAGLMLTHSAGSVLLSYCG